MPVQAVGATREHTRGYNGGVLPHLLPPSFTIKRRHFAATMTAKRGGKRGVIYPLIPPACSQYAPLSAVTGAAGGPKRLRRYVQRIRTPARRHPEGVLNARPRRAAVGTKNAPICTQSAPKARREPAKGGPNARPRRARSAAAMPAAARIIDR